MNARIRELCEKRLQEESIRWGIKDHIAKSKLWWKDVAFDCVDIALKEQAKKIKNDWEDTFGEPVYLTEWNEFWKKYTGDDILLLGGVSKPNSAKETTEISNNPKLMRKLKRGLKDIQHNKGIPLEEL